MTVDVRCLSCRGRCSWSDDAWVCVRCGDEWPADDPVFAPPDEQPVWERVRDRNDRRRTVYFRLVMPVTTTRPSLPVGAVSRYAEGWRAVGYRRHGPVVELGMHPGRRTAESWVLAYWRDSFSKEVK